MGFLWSFFRSTKNPSPTFEAQKQYPFPRIPGTPKNGKFPILFPYHSHIFRDSYGISNEKKFG